MNTYGNDQQQLDSFDLALLGQLRQEVTHRRDSVQQGPRPKRRIGLAAAAVAAATAAVVGFTTFGSTAGAYAVDSGADGSITITIHRLDDAAGLQKDLADHGVKATVDYQALGTSGGAGEPKVEHRDFSNGVPDGYQAVEGGTATAQAPLSGSDSTGPAPQDSPCGSPENPALTTTMSHDDYVITIPKNSVLHQADSALRITTTGDLKDSVAGINVNYSVGGADCGFGTVSASAGSGSIG